MKKSIIELAKELITIKSTPSNPGALEEIFQVCHTHLKGYTIEIFERNGVKSALIYKSSKRPKRFKVILNGHLDIIP
jgi:succinyl-diaminopimelate desuccinylase